MSNVELDVLRGRLDEINGQLLELISERAKIVQEIGVVKEKQGVPKFDPEREKKMLDQLVASNKGPFTDGTIRSLFKQIFQLLWTYNPMNIKNLTSSTQGSQRRYSDCFAGRCYGWRLFFTDGSWPLLRGERTTDPHRSCCSAKGWRTCYAWRCLQAPDFSL